MPVDLRLLSGGPEEMAALQQVLEGAPTYAERVTGHPPGPADAQSLMTILPPDIDYADKFVWGVMLDGEMVGCADVIRGWPSVDTAHIGLLVLERRTSAEDLAAPPTKRSRHKCVGGRRSTRSDWQSWPLTPRSWLSGIAWASARQVKSGPSAMTSSSRSRSF